MSSFATPVSLEHTGETDASGRALYRLNHDLVYEVGCPDSGLRIVVPEGRVTNLATVPRSRLLSWLYRDIAAIDGRYIAAPVLHDYLCNEQFPGITMTKSGFSRFEADAIFRSSLQALGAPRWQVLTAYLAVRASALSQGITT